MDDERGTKHRLKKTQLATEHGGRGFSIWRVDAACASGGPLRPLGDPFAENKELVLGYLFADWRHSLHVSGRFGNFGEQEALIGFAGDDPKAEGTGSQGGSSAGEIHFAGLSFSVVTHHAFGSEDGFDVGGEINPTGARLVKGGGA